MKRLASSLACLALFTPVLTATSITFVGVETDSTGTVQNWSNTAVTKTHDRNGDDRFGGAGYYQIMPAEFGVDFGGSWSVTLDDPNDLGISLPDVPPEGVSSTFESKPAFLTSHPDGGGGSCFIFDTNPTFYDPSGTSPLRQGSLAVSIINYEASGPGGVLASSAKAFSFTLSEAAEFRLGLAVDTLGELGSGAYAPDYVSVYNVNTGEVFSTSLFRNGTPDMVFFDIAGAMGDVFFVNLWQTNGAVDGPVAFALVTFDQDPTPTLTYVQDGSDFTLSWEQNIPGWLLESSTDLGSADDWDPVPGVLNNSVTLDMTGVPKNFFRLRKDP